MTKLFSLCTLNVSQIDNAYTLMYYKIYLNGLLLYTIELIRHCVITNINCFPSRCVFLNLNSVGKVYNFISKLSQTGVIYFNLLIFF